MITGLDAFDDFPPGLTGRTLVLAGRLPPALFGLFMQQMPEHGRRLAALLPLDQPARLARVIGAPQPAGSQDRLAR